MARFIRILLALSALFSVSILFAYTQVEEAWTRVYDVDVCNYETPKGQAKDYEGNIYVTGNILC